MQKETNYQWEMPYVGKNIGDLHGTVSYLLVFFNLLESTLFFGIQTQSWQTFKSREVASIQKLGVLL
jgi:hypothetical protein